MKNRKSSNKSESSLLPDPAPSQVHQKKTRHSLTSWYVEPSLSPTARSVSPSASYLSPSSPTKVKLKK